MSQNLYLRKYARIPFPEEIIIEDQKGFNLGVIDNISVKGIAIHQLTRPILGENIWLLLKLPEMKAIKNLNKESLMELRFSQTLGKVFKSKMKILRSSQIAGELCYQIAGVFEYEQEGLREHLQEFVNNYTFNVVHLIKMLEKNRLTNGERDLIFLLSESLNRKEKNIEELRTKVFKDFQNI